MTEQYHKQLELFKSLFKGRSDIFATRWEKDGKSGYMPVYSFDPYRFMAHKRNGGTFQNYPDKSYLPLGDEQYSKHLNGEQLVGLNPLLEDNTLLFIAADFDKSKLGFKIDRLVLKLLNKCLRISPYENAMPEDP
jgi:hypothetical protein